MSEVIDKIETEMAKIVSDIRSAASTPDTPTPSILSTVAAITPTANHIAKARALGIDPAAHLSVIKQHIAETIEAFKQFSKHIPANDPNATKISDLIGRLS